MNYKIFVAVTKESDKIITKSTSNEDVPEIKLEPDGFHDSMVDVSEGIDNNSDSFELISTFKAIEGQKYNVSGKFYYKN